MREEKPERREKFTKKQMKAMQEEEEKLNLLSLHDEAVQSKKPTVPKAKKMIMEKFSSSSCDESDDAQDQSEN